MRWLSLMVLVAGCVSPVVGAECRPGLTACDGRCVDLASDVESCGECGVACSPGEWCLAGECSPAGTDDAAWPELDGGVASTSDAGPLPRLFPERPSIGRPAPTLRAVCGLGELACDGGCVRADRDPAHCGGCGLACAAGESCVEGACAASCEAPFVACGTLCIDTRHDPDHCGGCGAVCETGVCSDGVCESPLAGHLVVIGHDYTSRRDAMGRIVGNATLLPRSRTVRVLAYEGAASRESRGGTIAAIEATARETARAWAHEPVEAELVSYRLAFADVFLVHAQSAPQADAARAIGRSWEAALRTFLERGGTVVALVGPSEPGTLTLLESAGLVRGGTATTEITGAVVNVVRSSDAVAVGVPLAYRAERASVRLPLELEAAVVTDGIGPVVAHFAITPPVD